MDCGCFVGLMRVAIKCCTYAVTLMSLADDENLYNTLLWIHIVATNDFVLRCSEMSVVISTSLKEGHEVADR